MKHRSVVANFIFKWSDRDRTKQQVALFRRSHHPNIRSYQGKYAPISGSIEADDANPELAAEREILEETQLVAGDDLVLEFCGQPYSFEDEQAGRSWTVHPFGWLLKVDDTKIKIDWEHDSWAWFDPQDVLDSSMSDQCVPKLEKSLQLVYFGPNGMFRGGGYLVGRGNTAGMKFFKTVDWLKNDIEYGARVLALEALKGLHAIAECFKSTPIEGQRSPEYWHGLVVAAYHFTYSARPSMNAAIRTTMLNALGEVRKSLDENGLDPAVACRTLETHMTQQKSSDKIARAFKAFVDQTIQQGSSTHATSGPQQQQDTKSETTINIITLSHSSTIFVALANLLTSPGPITTINLTILETRPLCEGASLASSLINHVKSTSPLHPHLNIKIVPETYLAHILTSPIPPTQPHPTLILLGADRIDPDGTILNKTGSLALAILAKTLAPNTTRVVMLSETAKISPVTPANLDSARTLLEQGSTASKDDVSSMNRVSQSGLLEAHPAQEVYAAWPKDTQDMIVPYLGRSRDPNRVTAKGQNSDVNVSVSIENMYFETVPSSYIAAYITEEGELNQRDILRISVERRELEDRIFGGMYS